MTVPTKAYVCPKIDEDECACAFGDKEDDSLYVCYCHTIQAGELGVPHVRMIERSALEELEWKQDKQLADHLIKVKEVVDIERHRAAEMVRDIACEDFSQEDAKPLFDLADRIEEGKGDD
jgi:hypothetical protein